MKVGETILLLLFLLLLWEPKVGQLMLLMYLPMLLLQVFLFIMVLSGDCDGLEILDWFHFLTVRYMTFEFQIFIILLIIYHLRETERERLYGFSFSFALYNWNACN